MQNVQVSHGFQRNPLPPFAHWAQDRLSEGEALVWPVPHEHRLPEPSPLWMSEVQQCNITCIDDAHPPNFISRYIYIRGNGRLSNAPPYRSMPFPLCYRPDQPTEVRFATRDRKSTRL